MKTNNMSATTDTDRVCSFQSQHTPMSQYTGRRNPRVVSKRPPVQEEVLDADAVRARHEEWLATVPMLRAALEEEKKKGGK